MIKPIHNNLNLLSEVGKTANKSDGNTSFTGLLKENLEDVNQLQKGSEEIIKDFSLGKVDNVHEVTVAAEKARLAVDLTTAIQSKVLDAYQEIMRIQL